MDAVLGQSIPDTLGKLERPTPWTPGGLRILIVDCDWPAAEQLALALNSRGHTLRLARRGAEALVVGEEFQPNLVLIETGGAPASGCPTSVLLRCRRWAEHLVLIGHSRFENPERRHRELLHYEFSGAVDVDQLVPIYDNLLVMRGVLRPVSV